MWRLQTSIDVYHRSKCNLYCFVLQQVLWFLVSELLCCLAREQKARVKPVYRRTLSAAELYNLPLPELSHPSNIFTDNHIRTVRQFLSLVQPSLSLSLSRFKISFSAASFVLVMSPFTCLHPLILEIGSVFYYQTLTRELLQACTPRS